MRRLVVLGRLNLGFFSLFDEALYGAPRECESESRGPLERANGSLSLSLSLSLSQIITKGWESCFFGFPGSFLPSAYVYRALEYLSIGV